MQSIDEIEELVKIISKLPGLGPKSARRIILKLINNKEKIHKPLINSLADVFKNIQRCNECGALSSSKSHCSNCKIEKKKINKICVVETISDQWSIETSNVFNGYFHILGGTISLNKSENKDSLLINSLVEKVRNNSIDEVILATSSTVEGQTTAFYIQDALKDSNIKISRLAQGIPVGGEIENLDDGTLISAFKNRKEIND
jgi:recombination protein RecR|tara:strand:- start:126 stop:731 length:606 start_codon:yes stop_codon:yes gene_type:complete